MTAIHQVWGELGHEPGKGAMPDVFRVADLLVSRALASHGEEIDIIAYYGSYAQGMAREGSDLDIFYIPCEGKDPPVGHTVLIAGLLYDFWGISWETMEGFATGRVRGWSFAPAIVHHARMLHARSDEQAARFAALKQSVLRLQEPEARPQMIRRALKGFANVLAYLGNLQLAASVGDLTDVRYVGWRLILAAWECLALANQTFCDRGWAHLLEEIPRLRCKPENLEQSIVTISTSDDTTAIADAAKALALGTRQVLRELQSSLAGRQPASQVFESAYPELEDGFRKVLQACEREQAVAASAAAWSAQSELSFMLYDLEHDAGDGEFNLYNELAPVYRRLGFPDLMGAGYKDLTGLAERARALDLRLRQWLGKQSVSLSAFETLEEFERSLC